MDRYASLLTEINQGHCPLLARSGPPEAPQDLL